MPYISEADLKVEIVSGSLTSLPGGLRGHAEDSPHTNSDVGVMALAIFRPFGPSVDTGSDGDYAPLSVNSSGALYVSARGDKTSNAQVPGATNLGTLPAIATAAVPSYTEGQQVGLSTDLAGKLRTDATQYTEGDVDTSITGTAVMWEDTGDTMRSVSVVKPLPAQISDGTRTATVRDTGTNDSLNVAVVDAAGNQVTSFGLSMTDDAAFTVGSSSITPIGALADETTPDSVDEGDVGAVRMTLDRHLRSVAEQINGSIRVGASSLEVKWIKINATASGDNTIISAVASKKLRVIGIAFVCSSSVDIIFKSGANTLIDAMQFAKNGGIADNGQPVGYWLETNSGEAFIMNLNSAVNVRGRCYYVEV